MLVKWPRSNRVYTPTTTGRLIQFVDAGNGRVNAVVLTKVPDGTNKFMTVPIEDLTTDPNDRSI